MLINQYILAETFVKWCDLYFTNYLVLPRFIITKNFKHVARFECELNSYSGKIRNEVIYFSNQFDYTQQELDSIMVHEMIHYYLCKNGCDQACSHGKMFNKLANELNERFGLNVGQYVNGLTKRKDYSRWKCFLSRFE